MDLRLLLLCQDIELCQEYTPDISFEGGPEEAGL